NPRVSSRAAVPGCGMQSDVSTVPPSGPATVQNAGENALTGTTVGPLSVEFAGVTKSAWNRKTSSAKTGGKFDSPGSRVTTGLVAPAGGAMAPSKSAARRSKKELGTWKQICGRAATPA